MQCIFLVPTKPLQLWGINTSDLEAVAFLKPAEKTEETLKELQKIFKQNNYTNAFIQY